MPLWEVQSPGGQTFQIELDREPTDEELSSLFEEFEEPKEPVLEQPAFEQPPIPAIMPGLAPVFPFQAPSPRQAPPAPTPVPQTPVPETPVPAAEEIAPWLFPKPQEPPPSLTPVTGEAVSTITPEGERILPGTVMPPEPFQPTGGIPPEMTRRQEGEFLSEFPGGVAGEATVPEIEEAAQLSAQQLEHMLGSSFLEALHMTPEEMPSGKEIADAFSVPEAIGIPTSSALKLLWGFANWATSPSGATQLAAIEAAPLSRPLMALRPALLAKWSADIAASGGESAGRFWEALRQGDYQTASDAGGQMLVDLALLTGGPRPVFRNGRVAAWERMPGLPESALKAARGAYDAFFAKQALVAEENWKKYQEEGGVTPEEKDIVKREILKMRRYGPTPEQRALFNRIDPETAGTTYEAVVKYAKSIGMDASHVVKPAPKAPTEKPVEAPAPAPQAEGFTGKPLEANVIAEQLKTKHGIEPGGFVTVADDFAGAPESGRIRYDAQGKPIGIELNRSQLATPAQVDWTIQHEAAHFFDLLNPEAASRIREAVTAQEWNTIQKAIEARKYGPREQAAERTAFAMQELARQWGKRKWFGRLTGQVQAFVADRLGIKLPRRAAELTAARAITQSIQKVAEAKTPEAPKPAEAPKPTEAPAPAEEPVPKDWVDQFKGLPPKPKPSSRPIMVRAPDGSLFPAYSEGVGSAAVKDPETGKTVLGQSLWISRQSEAGWTTGPIRPGEKVVAGEPHTEAVKPEAPKAPAAPAPAATEIETLLKVEVPDVTEAKTRTEAIGKRQEELRKQYGQLDQEVKALEKQIMTMRGYPRVKRIKQSARKADVARFRELTKHQRDLETQIRTLDETARSDRIAVGQAEDAAVIKDTKQPLIRRLDRAVRLAQDQQRTGTPEFERLVRARDEETYRVIRERYPDATEAELTRMAPEVQREAYFGPIPWDRITTPNELRQARLGAELNNPDFVAIEYLPEDLRQRIQSHLPNRRGYTPTPEPVVPLGPNDVEDIIKRVRKASENYRKEAAAKEKAAAEEKAKAEAEEEKLIVAAEQEAASVGKGERTPRQVRDELVARIKGAIDKLIAQKNPKISTAEDLITATTEDKTASGTVEPTKGGKLTVSFRLVEGAEGLKVTVPTREDAEWAVKAAASIGAGKVVIGVPGDGVFRIHKDGRILLKVWNDARKIDVSKGRVQGVSKGGVEKPPSKITTVAEWNEAQEYHGLTATDRIYDWSPALRVLAEKILPTAPEKVTVAMVDEFVRTKKKPEAPPAPEAPEETPSPEAPAPEAPAPAAPAPQKPLVGEERAKKLRERIKKKLAEPPPPEEPQMALESREDFGEMIERAKRLDRELIARNMAAVPADATVVKLQNASGRTAIVSPDPVEKGAWRLTYFTEEGDPWGHGVLPTRDEAIQSALGIYGKTYGPPHLPRGYNVVGARAPSKQELEDREAMDDLEMAEKKPKLDPRTYSDAVQLGAYYIQAGFHKFAPWAEQMRSDLGPDIEPYLKSIYENARISIEAPASPPGQGLSPGLQSGLLPPGDRIVTARGQQTVQGDESVIPQRLLKFLDPHQRQGSAVMIQSMVDRGGGLNADGTGVGKTRQSLTVGTYWADQPNTKVVIVAPAGTFRPNWKKGTFGGSYKNDSEAMGVPLKLARDAKVKPGEIGITTYENHAAVLRNTDENTVLILDEAHYIKNRSQRGDSLARAIHKAKAVLFLSATPADKPEHIYYLDRIGIMEGKSTQQQLKDLGMTLVEMTKLVKDETTGQMVRRKLKFWAPDQNVTERERNERFNALFDRMTASGAMIKREISMQGTHVEVLKLTLPPDAQETLDEIVRFFEAESIDELKGLKKAIALMHLRRQQEPFKIAPTVLLTQRELDAGRQVVIFVSRVNESEVGKWVKGPGGDKTRVVLMSSEGTAKALRDALHEAGIHDIAEIHGEADQHALEAMDDFNGGKKRVMIATIESGGTGINLDDIVGNRPRSMIVVTAPFDAVGNVQAAGRIWRLKTLSGSNFFYLFGDTDVDDWNADIIGSKMAHLGAVVEGQVRRLDIADPERVSTDDFGKVRRKRKEGAAPGGLPQLVWEQSTTKAGNPVWKARATKPFWDWWRSGGKEMGRQLGIATIPDRETREWYVWARTIPPGMQAPEPPPAENPQMGPGGETGMESRFDTDSGLPPGVADGGPDFAMELLEASRRLQTLVRSRVTLPPGVLGRYIPARAAISRADAIEVGDINNQLTVAHEMGHDLDALLFPAIFPANSQESLAARVGLPKSEKKKLFEELKAVSELMRGPMIGSKGHVNYRKRAVELIADFFALYLHDPERARGMAPTWTPALEAELAKNADASETVRQLHARNVTPIAPPGGGRPPTGALPTGMPGAVPPRPEPSITRENAAALAAEELVPKTIRRFEAEVQGARIQGELWRLDVPNPQDRLDVGAFVEGIGNLEIPGDTREAVIRRMTPKMMRLAKQYRHRIEFERQRLNRFLHELEEGEYFAFLEDYLPHFYVNAKTPAGKEAMARFKKSSPNARQRILPTLREAVEYGFIPVTQDPTILYELYARINWRVATNRYFLAALKRIFTADGTPVVLPASKNPGGWPVSNNPLIQRVYARRTPKGLMLWRGGAAIHPDVWHAVRQILEVPTRSDLGRIYDSVNALTRATAFAFSGFHDITLRSAALGGMATATNPLRGLYLIFERDPITGDLKILQSTRKVGKRMLMNQKIVSDAALHGLKFSWTDTETYQHGARDALEKLALRLKRIPFLGSSARFLRDLQAWRQKGLWRNTHDAFKIIVYNDLVSKALASAPPGTNPTGVKQTIASLLNDCFGGQEWQTKFWLSPQIRLMWGRFWLAPDWTLSTLRSVPMISDVSSRAVAQLPRLAGEPPRIPRQEGWKGNIGRARFWTAEIAALALATIAAQYAIYLLFGKKEKGDKPWVWENEFGQNRRIDVTPVMRQLPWSDPEDPTRYYANLGKRPEEILTWFIHPEKNIQAKMARPLIELVRQITGMEGEFQTEWAREHMTFAESVPSRLSSLRREFQPFILGGNQFALSVPYRKGMSRYKTEQAFEKAYGMIADPSPFKRLARGHFMTNMETLLQEIRDAAERNGVNVRQSEARAKYTIRGKYYRDYFRAYKEDDMKGMEEAADALERLGAGTRNIRESVQRRLKLEPVAP